MYRLFKLWLYVKIIFEILGKIKSFIGKILKTIIKRNIFCEENAIHKKEQ